MKNKGFTLIELVLVIAILGVLAVSALPNIFNTALTNARSNSRDAVVGAVQAGVALYASQQLSAGNDATYPGTLGGAGAASRSNPIFSTVIQGGVTRGWTAADPCYTWTEGGASDEYLYNSATGAFTFTACP
jgi:prepilin-type N-terminal cleavage/methylation domain-containing protein